jgi:hypothetical protein
MKHLHNLLPQRLSLVLKQLREHLVYSAFYLQKQSRLLKEQTTAGNARL